MSLAGRPINRRILLVDDSQAIHQDYRKVLGLGVTADGAQMDQDEERLFGVDRSKVQLCQPPSFELVSNYQGQEALEEVRKAMAQERPFAVVFMDVRMPPGWDGVETLERLWEVDPHLQAVICTAYSDYSWQELLARFSNSDRFLILKKPFDKIEVRQAALALAEKWNLAAAVRDRIQGLNEQIAEQNRKLERQNHALQKEVVQRSASERQLRLLQRHNQELLNAISAAMIAVDLNGLILDWNPAAARQFGLAIGQVLGKPLAQLQIRWDVGRVQELIERVKEVRRPLVERRMDYADPQGQSRTLELSVNPILGQERQIVGCLLLAEDVTRDALLEQELVRARKNETIGRLASGLAQELQEPLDQIARNLAVLEGTARELQAHSAGLGGAAASAGGGAGSASAVRSGGWSSPAGGEQDLARLDRQIPEASKHAMRGLDRIAAIVASMKSFSDSSASDAVDFDLNQAIRTTLETTRRDWAELAQVELVLEPDLPPLVGNPTRIIQSLFHLLANARDAIRDHGRMQPEHRGRILIQTRRTESGIQIRFQDNGCGIPAEYQDRIFDPFFSTKNQKDAVGLGLAYVYKAVTEGFGGKVNLESKAGEGACFTLSFPLPREAGKHCVV